MSILVFPKYPSCNNILSNSSCDTPNFGGACFADGAAADGIVGTIVDCCWDWATNGTFDDDELDGDWRLVDWFEHNSVCVDNDGKNGENVVDLFPIVSAAANVVDELWFLPRIDRFMGDKDVDCVVVLLLFKFSFEICGLYGVDSVYFH